LTFLMKIKLTNINRNSFIASVNLVDIAMK